MLSPCPILSLDGPLKHEYTYRILVHIPDIDNISEVGTDSRDG
jgi:hypothetical protein